MKITNPFDLEQQYKFYLSKVELSEEKMHPIQRKETKQAFFAGMAQMLLMCRDEIPNHPEKDAIMYLENMLEQIEEFFKNLQTSRHFG